MTPSTEPSQSDAAPAPEVWCVVVAGGAGRRFGAAKQWVELAGRRVADHSVAAAAQVSDGVVLVVPAGDLGTGDPETRDPETRDPESGDAAAPSLGATVVGLTVADRVAVDCTLVAGGATRSASVRAGLAAVPSTASVVLVHDAARPLATPQLFERVVAAVLAGADAAIPVVPVSDTIRHLDGGVVDRDRLRAVQTPQGFSAAVLRSVHATAPEATDDAGLVEAAGGSVVLVDGEPANLKLTDPHDLAVAAALLSERGVGAEAPGGGDS